SGRLAELFAATINESHGLGLIDETGDYTVSVALTDDVADNGRSVVEVLRREQFGEIDGEVDYALGVKIAGWTIPVPTDADDVIDQALTAAEAVLAEHGWKTAGPWRSQTATPTPPSPGADEWLGEVGAAAGLPPFFPFVKEKTMLTAAEFKTLREHLGIPGEWLARRFGVSDRSVRHWDSGEYPVPERISRWLRWL